MAAKPKNVLFMTKKDQTLQKLCISWPFHIKTKATNKNEIKKGIHYFVSFNDNDVHPFSLFTKELEAVKLIQETSGYNS